MIGYSRVTVQNVLKPALRKIRKHLSKLGYGGPPTSVPRTQPNTRYSGAQKRKAIDLFDDEGIAVAAEYVQSVSDNDLPTRAAKRNVYMWRKAAAKNESKTPHGPWDHVHAKRELIRLALDLHESGETVASIPLTLKEKFGEVYTTRSIRRWIEVAGESGVRP